MFITSVWKQMHCLLTVLSEVKVKLKKPQKLIKQQLNIKGAHIMQNSLH